MTEVLDRVSFADKRIPTRLFYPVVGAPAPQSRVGPILGSWKEASLPRRCDSARLRSSFTAEPKTIEPSK